MSIIIISRHPATTAWIIKTAGLPASTPVITGNATAADVAGQEVYGNVPLHLAALADCVHAVEFAGAPPRGAEYSLADMEAAGARLHCYEVQDYGPSLETDEEFNARVGIKEV